MNHGWAVVMQAYLIVRHPRQAWSELDGTVEEGLGQLTTLCATQILVKGEVRGNQIPTPGDLSQKLLISGTNGPPRINRGAA